MRLVADLVRGKAVEKALGILKFNTKSASVYIEKLLMSALSNWQTKNENKDISGVTTVSTLRSNIGIFSGTVTGEHHGDGSNLTGVASTENIRTNTNATFLQNINVVFTKVYSGPLKHLHLFHYVWNVVLFTL